MEIIDEETQQILQTCSVSTRAIAQTFFPERFNLPFAGNVHGKIFDLIDGAHQSLMKRK